MSNRVPLSQAARMFRGSVKYRRVSVEGVNAIKTGNLVSWIEDPYPFLISIGWIAFFAAITGVYLILNLLFAIAYWARPGSIAGSNDFTSDFFFSVETMTTVGYGTLTPHSLYGHVVSVIELICGVFVAALITGLIFARFSKPRAQLLFSNVCVIAPYGDGLALMARVANRRTGLMTDVNARLTLSVQDSELEDTSHRRFLDLPLERSFSPLFGLVWTLVHPIGEESPIAPYGCDLPSHSAIIASVTANDDSIASTVTARKTYSSFDILSNKRFKDVISKNQRGTMIVDLDGLDDVI